MSTFRTDPDGTRLPIKLDSTSNGEFEPIPLSATNRAATKLAQEHVTINARPSSSRLLALREFTFQSAGAVPLGFVGGAARQQQPRARRPANSLDRPGMTFVRPLVD